METTISLNALTKGEKGILSEFLDTRIACKLMAMGILPGKEIVLIRRVPFGGGLYLKVAGQNFAIRNEEARQILVVRVPNLIVV